MFWNRRQELAALGELDGGGGLAVVWGRRRIGKTRLLLEWSERAGGVYTVADQSAPDLQRAYFARAISQALPGFADVTYPDWERLLSRLAADAMSAAFTGPIVIDELPYLVAASPELPSILQRWIDHEAKRAKLRIALAGSSQRMMQGLVLSHTAPLYGRARVTLDVTGLSPDHLRAAFGRLTPTAVVEHWAAFGGVPRYWELAAQRRGSARDRVLALALDPLGPLFAEPERLLLEESPPAVELRPVLDAIGAGAHRLSEIAGRLGRPATSLGHALDRLTGMALVHREVPYGESAKGGKRSLYKIDDPFLRLWFRAVAPNRAALTAGTPPHAPRCSTSTGTSSLAKPGKSCVGAACPRSAVRLLAWGRGVRRVATGTARTPNGISSPMRSTVDVCSSERPGSPRGAPPRRCWSAKRGGSPVARSPR
jgi:hypothetical protein